MKTMAIRLEDDVAELLAVIAQLEDTSIIDQIRQAIATHLERKVADGDLAAQAEALVAAIDHEADAKKAAIGELIGKAGPTAKPKAPTRRGRGKPASEEALVDNASVGRLFPIGFAPPSRHRGDE